MAEDKKGKVAGIPAKKLLAPIAAVPALPHLAIIVLSLTYARKERMHSE